MGGDQIVHVPENGPISLNVPLDPLRLGALSTKTTHPYYMARFNELLVALGLKVKPVNTYAFKTKGEMIRECRDQSFIARAAADTMFCSSPAKVRWQGEAPKHCGYCVPCLIRRASMLAGLGNDLTDYSIPDLKAGDLDSSEAEGMHVRSFQRAITRLRKRPTTASLDIHLPGPLIDHPDWLLTALETTRFIDTSKAVLHWFTGTQAEARRAVEMGCYFSINAEMLRTDRHRTLVASLPHDRLLTETDGPFVETPRGTVRPLDVKETVVRLADVFGFTAEDMRSGLISNPRELLS